LLVARTVRRHDSRALRFYQPLDRGGDHHVAREPIALRHHQHAGAVLLERTQRLEQRRPLVELGATPQLDITPHNSRQHKSRFITSS
jgi:hypothetical protein